MAKTKELKKRYGAEEGRLITSVLERAVSRERLFLFSAEHREEGRGVICDGMLTDVVGACVDGDALGATDARRATKAASRNGRETKKRLAASLEWSCGCERGATRPVCTAASRGLAWGSANGCCGRPGLPRAASRVGSLSHRSLRRAARTPGVERPARLPRQS